MVAPLTQSERRCLADLLRCGGRLVRQEGSRWRPPGWLSALGRRHTLGVVAGLVERGLLVEVGERVGLAPGWEVVW